MRKTSKTTPVGNQIHINNIKACVKCTLKKKEGRYMPLKANRFRQRWVCTKCEDLGFQP